MSCVHPRRTKHPSAQKKQQSSAHWDFDLNLHSDWGRGGNSVHMGGRTSAVMIQILTNLIGFPSKLKTKPFSNWPTTLGVSWMHLGSSCCEALSTPMCQCPGKKPCCRPVEGRAEFLWAGFTNFIVIYIKHGQNDCLCVNLGH